MALSRVILNAAALIVLSCIAQETTASVIRRTMPGCPICTREDYARCPNVVAGPTCEVIDEPNCGCCKMCAKRVGEHCGVATGWCENDLECVPPPLSKEDYEQYGFSDYIMQASAGDFVCVTKEDYFKMITDYMGDSESFDVNYFFPDITDVNDAPPTQRPVEPAVEEPVAPAEGMVEVSVVSKEDAVVVEEDIIVPIIMPVSSRPTHPLPPPYPHSQKPCEYHFNQVLSQAHYQKHQWLPSCNEQGDYIPEQCELSFGLEHGRCWCVDSKGNAITTFRPGSEARPKQCKPQGIRS